MKKFLGMIVIAGVLASCSNSGSNDQRVKDSTDSAKRADSISSAMPAPAAPDTTHKMGGDSSGMNKMGGDTTKMNKMAGDSSKK